MSKSLKNFITIKVKYFITLLWVTLDKEALTTKTARQIRFLFLLHKYDAVMDYSEDALSQARDQEKVFAGEFVVHCK